MIVGIIPRNKFNQVKGYEIDIAVLDYNKIPYEMINRNEILQQCMEKKITHLLYRWGHDDENKQIAQTYLPIIERELKIPVFPDQKTCWHYDDKIKQHWLLKVHNYPVVDSWIFYDKGKAIEWAQKTTYPKVFKLRGGAGSSNVLLVKSLGQALVIIKRSFGRGNKQGSFGLMNELIIKNYDLWRLLRNRVKIIRNFLVDRENQQHWQVDKNYVYFQEYLPGNEFDIRVTTAGNRVHAFRRFVRRGDFRASGGDRWDLDPLKIEQKVIKTALEISKNLGFQAMAYDFIYDKYGDPRIIEMSYLYGKAGYPDFMNGYWDQSLNWTEGRFLPQYFELLDLLQLTDLKMPEIRIEDLYQTVTLST